MHRAEGAAIATGLRSGDTSGRIGGEEFCLMLSETSLAEALAVAERLQQVVCVPSPQEGCRTFAPRSAWESPRWVLDQDEGFESTLARLDESLSGQKERTQLHPSGATRLIDGVDPACTVS